ncbi:MAG TPA: hypothetical protein VMV40_01575 [Acidiferrobacter sp.]|nr:hypothetical protein [Acidiferrobacter sp.]
MNDQSVNIEVTHKAFSVELTSAASRALDARSEPLVVEMELFFSCLVRKRLRWGKQVPTEVGTLSGVPHAKLQVWFHPVMAQHCDLPDNDDLSALPLMDFPLARKEAFTPRWLHLDYHGGEFRGDFGW